MNSQVPAVRSYKRMKLGIRNDAALRYGVPVHIWEAGIPVSVWGECLQVSPPTVPAK